MAKKLIYALNKPYILTAYITAQNIAQAKKGNKSSFLFWTNIPPPSRTAHEPEIRWNEQMLF